MLRDRRRRCEWRALHLGHPLLVRRPSAERPTGSAMRTGKARQARTGHMRCETCSIEQIDPQHFRDAENVLPMRNGIEYIFIQVMPQYNRPFSLAASYSEIRVGLSRAGTVRLPGSGKTPATRHDGCKSLGSGSGPGAGHFPSVLLPESR